MSWTGLGGSPIYPQNCNGTVTTTYVLEPHMCSMNKHWPPSQCDAAQWAYYELVPYYSCVPNPSSGTTNPPTSGGGNTGGGTPTPPEDEEDITVMIQPIDDCNEHITGDLNGDCQLSPYETCLLGGNSEEVCDCVAAGGNIEDCQDENDCNTSKDDLKLVFPNTPDSTLEEIANNINLYAADFGIDTKEELQHFLAQAGHESTNYAGIRFGTFTENLNYKIANLGVSAFERVFNPASNPTADPNKANPNDYINPANPTYANKELLANYVYDDANRLEGYKLGNVNVGDGYKYIGRGIIQLTGKENYTNFNTFYQENYDNSVNLVTNPELVASDKKIAVISALWFFKNNVMDEIPNGINENTPVKKITKLINGKYKGFELYS